MRYRLFPVLLLCISACVQQPASAYAPPPGVSYAWVTFDASRPLRSEAFGLADRAQQRQLTVHDPVRIASVTKLVVGLGVMRLVERGQLDLDEDVSQKLGWQLRNPAFPEKAITLRHLLSHGSSLKDDGESYAVPLGKSLRQALSQEAAFDREHAPGTYFRYSNINFPVIASVMEKAGGERFDRLMDRLVLKPLNLKACFSWSTCSDAQIAAGVTLYNVDGSARKDDLESRRSPCQVASASENCDLSRYIPGDNGALFSPQGGLRISVMDLASIGQLFLNRGTHRGRPFLKATTLEALLRPTWTFNGSNGDTAGGFFCAYGLATQTLPSRRQGCRDKLFDDGRSAVGHAGEAYGLLSGLWIDRKRGKGVAYFAANMAVNSADGISPFHPIERQMAKEIAE